ncbi:MAG: prepilin-type N-terminal cleavage/methylation domain-containing protein [Phycisphaerales bacterium]|nr:MAG: prepilin-type N-terminal cleavage/methylation domain-containing protein [Phycisphaerales bacterium]
MERSVGPAHSAMRVRRAFTLLELLITIAAMLIILLAVMPSLGMGMRTRLVAATMNLVSDLEYARSLSIGEPDDPTMVRFAPDGSGYWVARASAPEEPIARHDGGAYSVTFGEGDAYLMSGVVVALSGAPENGGSVMFDAFGRRVPGADATITLGVGEDVMIVRVRASTGDVWID